jgi:hypothetical protein
MESIAVPVSGRGTACGSTDKPQPGPAQRTRPRRRSLGVPQLIPQFLLSQRHRDTLGVIDRSAVIAGDIEARHGPKRTRRTYATGLDSAAENCLGCAFDLGVSLNSIVDELADLALRLSCPLGCLDQQQKVLLTCFLPLP